MYNLLKCSVNEFTMGLTTQTLVFLQICNNQSAKTGVAEQTEESSRIIMHFINCSQQRCNLFL